MNCPNCQRLLYSRQHKTCGFCGEELPEELLLSEDERAEMKATMQDIADRRAAAKEKEEEQRSQRNDGGGEMMHFGG